MEFFGGATSLGSVAFTGGIARLEPSTLIPGPHAITATYSGDANHLTATAPAFAQIIDPEPDTIPPRVVLSAITGPVGGVYTVVASFSEPVSALDPTDLTLTHASAMVSGGAEAFTITLTPPAEGALALSIPAGAVQDSAGNGNTASGPVSALHDVTPPRMTGAELTGPVDGVYTQLLSFSEPVEGLNAAAISATHATITVSRAGREYVVTLVPTGGGPVTLRLPADRVSDGAGNGNAPETLLDLMPAGRSPTVTLSTSATGIADRAPVLVSIGFSESVSGATMAEITVTGGTATMLSGARATYEVSLIPSG